MATTYDAVIIGSGPNGLAAGIYLADKGLKVLILEQHKLPGGGMRTTELTLPGYQHDFCSAIHPMAYLSPYFQSLDLEAHGMEWIFPDASVAHPLDDGPAVILEKSIEATAASLGKDRNFYTKFFQHFSPRTEALFTDSLKPLGFPSNPALFSAFGSRAFMPATWFSKLFLKDERTKALFAGCAAHSILPFDKYFTTALGLIFLLTGHNVNWPFPKHGTGAMVDALVNIFKLKGGELQCETMVSSMADLPESRAYFFNTNPHQLADIAGDALPSNYKKRLRKYHYGPGVFKVDYALSDPIPWKDPNCLRASTIHVGGKFEEIAYAEKITWQGKHAQTPYVLIAQQSQFDHTRAPEGKHTGWAYCHVPNGSQEDMTDIIENQIERFAPGFRETVIARHKTGTSAFELYNPNNVGGAVTGGAADLSQLFTRPVARLNPYSTPNNKIYICSGSTPPGGGVHGMCGYWAAKKWFDSNH